MLKVSQDCIKRQFQPWKVLAFSAATLDEVGSDGCRVGAAENISIKRESCASTSLKVRKGQPPVKVSVLTLIR